MKCRFPALHRYSHDIMNINNIIRILKRVWKTTVNPATIYRLRMCAMDKFDIIIVGAGHAGCEAAFAAARMGARALLLTMNIDHVAFMSCNPSVGGLGKGHLVREIDALDGEMALNTDAAGIQFKVLNTKKGPAVRATRVQTDMALYARRMKRRL